MSLKRTKEQLIKLLDMPDNRVIAISGQWGTGKTTMWEQVKSGSIDDAVKNSLYVSLFGLSTVDQIKVRLIEAAIPGMELHGEKMKGLKEAYRIGISALAPHYKSLAALNSLNLLLMAPAVFKSKVLVLDDIERKHKNLGVDEILGFIDEYSKRHQARFVLVLNEEKLREKAEHDLLWSTFREKVIDHEVRLLTSAEEAFDIALGIASSKYAESMRIASVQCEITNIRVIVKTIRFANLVLSNQNLARAIQKKFVPPIVFYCAMHFRGLQDGPNFKFALSGESVIGGGRASDNENEPNEEEKKKDAWRSLMKALGVYEHGEFERQLVEFLESGLVDVSRVEPIISRHVAQVAKVEAAQEARSFLMRIIWDHRADVAQLLERARFFLPIAGSLDALVVSELASELAKMPGGAEIGEEIVDEWVRVLNSLDEDAILEFRDSEPNVHLHPKIRDAILAISVSESFKKDLVDAVLNVVNRTGWTQIDSMALSNASVDDFKSTIRDMENLEKLRKFMRSMFNMRLKREQYDQYFGNATQRFVDACRELANDATSPRLAGLIQHIFSGTTLAAEIEPEPVIGVKSGTEIG